MPHAASRSRTRRPFTAPLTDPLEPRRLLSSYSFVNLASLDSAQLSAPTGPLVRDTAGDLFFLATKGVSSSSDVGVYELAAGASSPTLLTTFTNGKGAVGALSLDLEGDLVGLSNTGGSSNDGFVWELKTGSASINTLAFFNNGTTGSNPALGPNLVMDPTGDLFGTTQLGGANNAGTVWELAKGNAIVTTLASFPLSVSNKSANGLVIDSSGNLFGTIGRNTIAGSHGAVWELTHGSSSVNVLATFNGTNGDDPSGPLYIDASGNVFGATTAGGSTVGGTNTVGDGTLFEIPAGSNSITTLASFTGTNGSAPSHGLVGDPNGNLFGTTTTGGSTNDGVVFELPAGSPAITALHTFNLNTTGDSPATTLLLDPSGNLFGTAVGGGPKGGGVVFELTPSTGGGGGGPSSLSGALAGKLPASVIAGQKINLTQTLTMTDSGPAPVVGSSGTQLFLSTGTSIDDSSVLIATVPKNLNLKPNAHVPVKFKVTSVPASVPADTYHVIVRITDPSGNTTDVPSSATLQVVAPQIDLAGAFTKTPRPGKFATVLTFKVSDLGNVPASGDLTYNVQSSPDGQSADATVITTLTRKINIKPGKSQTVAGLVNLPAGTYYILITLDPNNVFNDVNPPNNTFATQSSVNV